MDIRLALISGIDIPLQEPPLILHQPSLKEISYIGETDYFIGAQCLCINKSLIGSDETVLENLNNFQVFMTIMSEKEAKDKKDCTLKVLSLLLPEYKVIMLPRTLLLSHADVNITIDETNFDNFQNILKQIFCVSSNQMDQTTFNPANKSAKTIADKLMRGRQRVATQNGSLGTSILVQYLSVLVIGLHIPLESLLNLTLYQVYDLIERYGLYAAWDIDVRSRLAGGTPDSKPDNWMKNIH